MNKHIIIVMMVAFLWTSGFSQTEEAYNTASTSEDEVKTLDLSRLKVNQSLSFGMASGSGESGLKSQSLYSTLLTYQFSKPLTMQVSFDLPIHSTFNSGHNLSAGNIKSKEYFQNIPFSAAIQWQPSKNFMMMLKVSRNTSVNDQSNNGFWGNRYSMGSPFYNPFLFNDEQQKTKNDE